MQNPVWSYIFRSKKDERSLPDLLSQLPIFEGLSRNHIRMVMRNLHQRKYRKDETVFNESEPGAGLYIIESGRVQIAKHIEGAAPAILAEFGPGNFFGEIALIEEVSRSATAITTEETVLLALPKPDLDRLIERQPQLAVKILYNLSRLIVQRLLLANANLGELQEQLAAES